MVKVAEQLENMLNDKQTALLNKYRHLIKRGFRGAYVHGIDANELVKSLNAFFDAKK